MKLERKYCFLVPQFADKTRVDSFLASKISGLSRSALTGESCEIYINGSAVKKSSTVSADDKVELFYTAEVFDKVEPENIPLEVLYEDNSMLVINKAQGMVVHPGAGNIRGTVVNALAYRYGQDFLDSMADECDVSRPGIVHRLDKDTSGIMIIALTAKSHADLSVQFQNHEIEKHYYALCDGFFEKRQDFIECNLGRSATDRKLFSVVQSGGKFSKSHYSVEEQFSECALVNVRIYTGRTHQIRVHMRSIGHPVIGDTLYNYHLNRFPDFSLMLHSYSLKIKHPVTGEEMEFTAPLPDRFSCIRNFK